MWLKERATPEKKFIKDNKLTFEQPSIPSGEAHAFSIMHLSVI
jgi:hypothetical protein